MKFCPHCGGDLAGFLAIAPTTARPPGKYDQAKTWRRLVEQANACNGEPPDITALAFGLAKQIEGMAVSRPDNERGSPLRTIVHVAFDRKIVPEGGAVYMAARSGGAVGPQDLSYFESRGYLVEDGKVRVSEDIPVGAVFGALEYWGGEKQHRRWHMSEPIKVNASRNGDPLFMDEHMLAFSVHWKDTTKVGEAFLQLFETLQSGVRGGGSIAKPLVVEAVQSS